MRESGRRSLSVVCPAKGICRISKIRFVLRAAYGSKLGGSHPCRDVLDPVRGGEVDSRPVGRDAEIAEIWAFLSAASGTPVALAITGDAGIGKTVVWQHLLQAVSRSSKVLSCQPTSAERPLAFSALDDLLGDVAGEVLPVLSGPRRRAVEVALLRDPSPEPRRRLPGPIVRSRSCGCWREGYWTCCGSFPAVRRL